MAREGGARILELSDVSFAHHGRPASLDNVHLQVDAGQALLVEGPSGAGKSTLLRVASGLIPRVQGGRFSGSVTLDGQAISELAPHALPQRIGYVAQDPETLFVARTLERELAGVLENVGMGRREARWTIEETLGEFDLLEHAQRELATLSGGEVARAALAAALVARPRLLVLDEADGQLDDQQRLALAGTLRALQASGLAVLASVHPPHPFDHLRARRFQFHEDHPSPHLPKLASVDEEVAPVLTLHDATHAHGDAATLQGVSLDVRPGEVVALTGANGAGKSTLLHLAAGLVGPGEGHVALRGENPRSLRAPALAARLGIAFQHPAWHITQDSVRDEVALTARALGRAIDAEAWLRRAGLTHLAAAHPWDLSGGERQRLAVATAAAHEPDLLLLDEPTRGMDATARARFAALLAERSHAGKATLVATHHTELAALAHRELRLVEGRLQRVRDRPLEVSA